MLFLEQIKHAHLIVANKVDLLTEDEIANVSMQLQAINSNAPIIQTSNSNISIKAIKNLEATFHEKEVKEAAIGKQLSLASRLHTFKAPVDQQAFE